MSCQSFLNCESFDQTKECSSDLCTKQEIKGVGETPKKSDDASNQSNERQTVKAVILRTDGTAVEIAYDASPTRTLIQAILGAPPTIIGEWKKINVVLLRGKLQSTVPLNTHKLRFPFHERQFHGDILLYRVNSEGTLENFPLVEYEAFAAQKDDIYETKCSCVSSVEEKDEEEVNDIEEEIAALIDKQFEKKHGRKPTSREQRALTDTVSQTFAESIENVDEIVEEYEEECLHDEQDVTNQSPVKKRCGIDRAGAKQTPNRTDNDEEDEDETAMSDKLRHEIAEAFEIIREKGRQDAQYLAELVSETFYEINGKEAELEDIANVFKRVKEQLADEAKDELLDSEEQVTESETVTKSPLPKENATLTSPAATISEGGNVKDERKPIKFFSPVRNSKTPKQAGNGLNSVDRKLMERAVQHFRSIYQREPTEEENVNLSKFLINGDLPSYDSDDAGKDDVENTNPNVTKLTFDEDADESDSDYVPEKDNTCNEEKDAAEESENMAELVNDDETDHQPLVEINQLN